MDVTAILDNIYALIKTRVLQRAVIIVGNILNDGWIRSIADPTTRIINMACGSINSISSDKFIPLVLRLTLLRHVNATNR